MVPPMFVTPTLALVATLLPQSPDAPLATYKLLGKDAVITHTDVALEMAFHLQRRDQGREAIVHLVDATLTRQAATKAGLMPTEAEARAFWERLQDQLRASGRRPEDIDTVRHSDEKTWLADIAVQMAQERVVRKELGVRAEEQISPELLKLWLQEQKKQQRVVIDADQLPSGTVARIGGSDLSLLDLGLLLLRISKDEDRERFVRQVAYLDNIEALTRAAGITVTPTDLDRAIQQKRDDAANDPRYRGMTFDRLLDAQGLSVNALREQRVFRAQILLDKLALQRFPDSTLREQLAQDRQLVLDRVGPKRHLAIVFARALEEPNALVPDDFASARKRLEAARERLAKEDFTNVARIESDHGPSKLNGGDIGWHRAVSAAAPGEVLAAGFSTAVGEVSTPVRGEDGWYLVKVLEAEPVPDDNTLLRQWRAFRAQEFGKQLLDDAQVQMVGQPAAGAKDGK